jgi:hypothetical protein
VYGKKIGGKIIVIDKISGSQISMLIVVTSFDLADFKLRFPVLFVLISIDFC